MLSVLLFAIFAFCRLETAMYSIAFKLVVHLALVGGNEASRTETSVDAFYSGHAEGARAGLNTLQSVAEHVKGASARQNVISVLNAVEAESMTTQQDVTNPGEQPGVVIPKIMQPLHVHTQNGMMMQVPVIVPAWCNPCSNSLLKVTVDGMTYQVVVPANVHPGQTFQVLIPVQPQTYMPPQGMPPVIPDVLTPLIISEFDGFRTYSLVVPPNSGPGRLLKARTPEEEVLRVIVPQNVHVGSAFTVTQNLRVALERKHRCCCQDIDGQCLWYPTWALKSKKSCPRLFNTGSIGSYCAKDYCFLDGKNKCTETHHGEGKCVPSMDKIHRFMGERCQG